MLGEYMDMIEPMLAQLSDFDVHITGNWIIEPKYDGERIIASRNGSKLALWTRRHIQVNRKFPEIIKSLKKQIDQEKWILDGELTVSGGFSQLIKRNVDDELKINILSNKIPAYYNVFDILLLDEEDLINKPLYFRKKVLINAFSYSNNVRIVPFKRVTSKNVKKYFQEFLEQGYEGAVLKNVNSPYEPGRRSGQWLKLKKEETVDVNVIGATKSDSSLSFGALILEKDGKYFGKVGTGFNDLERKNILRILERNQAPLRIEIPSTIEPEILITSKPLPAEIKIQEFIKKSPRAPVWVRFRWN